MCYSIKASVKNTERIESIWNKTRNAFIEKLSGKYYLGNVKEVASPYTYPELNENLTLF